MITKGSTILSKKLHTLTTGGGVAFWAANFAVSLTPIAAEYRAALSIAYLPMIVASLIGGLMIGFLSATACLIFLTRTQQRI